MQVDTATDPLTFRFVRPTAGDAGITVQTHTSDTLDTWSTPSELGPDYLSPPMKPPKTSVMATNA